MAGSAKERELKNETPPRREVDSLCHTNESIGVQETEPFVTPRSERQPRSDARRFCRLCGSTLFAHRSALALGGDAQPAV